jgi:hypothetical protein
VTFGGLDPIELLLSCPSFRYCASLVRIPLRFIPINLLTLPIGGNGSPIDFVTFLQGRSHLIILQLYWTVKAIFCQLPHQ